jgi:O-antigen/teichoic acid export membrane protein
MKTHKEVKSMKSRVTTSTFAQVVSHVIVAGIGVLILKIVTGSLGLSSYGNYVTILAFVSTFSLLTDLGLNAIAGREIAKYPEKASEIISYNMGLRIALCVLIVPVTFWLGYLFYPNATPELRFGILLFASYLFFDSIRTVSLAYFTAKVRNDISAAVNALQHLLYLFLVIVVALSSSGLFGFLVGYILASVCSAFVAVLLVRKSNINIWPRVNITKWRLFFSMSLSLGIIQVINMAYLKMDSILLSILEGPASVGLYGVAYTLIVAFLAFPNFLMTALIPSMATASRKKVQMIVQKAFQYIAIFACALAAIGYIIREEIVVAVSSTNFADASTPFAILALASAFSYLSSVFGFASVSINKHHKIIFISIGVFFLNLILNLILIPHFSIQGAAWATAISELCALAGICYVFRRESGVKIKMLHPLGRPLAASLALLPVSLILQNLWSTESAVLNTIIASTVLSLIYLSFLQLLGGVPSEVREFVRKSITRFI